MALFFRAFFIAILTTVAAQPIQNRDTALQAVVNSNRVLLTTALPPLQQIPGAPPPFYTYLWDFGDGHFSTAQHPEHVYAKEGTYNVWLYAVNNYDDGKKPQRKKQKITIAPGAAQYAATPSAWEDQFFKANGIFELRYNCMAKPNDTMVIVMGWRHNEAAATKGKLYLLLNEKAYPQTCFDTAGFRFYRGEGVLPSLPLMASVTNGRNALLTESGSPPSTLVRNSSAAEVQKVFAAYRSVFAIDLGELAPYAAHFALAELHVTPQMIEDTNATLMITGVYVPESGTPVMHRLNVPVVNSHDPNKMNLKGGPLDYRFLKKHKDLIYKIRFQNNGDGPARRVKLDVSLPADLDPATIRVRDVSPFCPPCDSLADQRGCWTLEPQEQGAVFTFHQIYLPGSQQKGVQNKDSTQGFLEFSLRSRKKLENKPFRARTAIYFDNNPPIITNTATGRFLPTPSPLIMAGYEKALGNTRVSDGLVLGVGVAPIAPRRPYLQAELWYRHGLPTTTATVKGIPQAGVLYVDSLNQRFPYKSLDSSQTHRLSQLHLVPLQIRYNVNAFLSIGIGAALTVDAGGRTETTRTYYLSGFNGQNIGAYLKKTVEKTTPFSSWHGRPFIDLQAGRVKLGPHLGLRYYHPGSKAGFVYFYAGWRL